MKEMTTQLSLFFFLEKHRRAALAEALTTHKHHTQNSDYIGARELGRDDHTT